MTRNLSTKMKRLSGEAGVALLTTLLLLFLMSSLLVGFTILLMSNQQLAGSDNDDVQAFYGAEAGMEQLTAGLGNLFSQTYAPSMSQINTLQTTPPVVPGITYVTADGHSGYVIAPQAFDSNGNPAPTVSTIKSGPYVGMNALITEYTLTVNARTAQGREVKLQRTTQTVGIPMFQFGIFSDTDLDFFPGPNFNFGGRTHTNGNLFLAGGSTLTLSDKVDAYKDVIRANLENGWPTSSNYTGTVQITTNPGSSSYRSLGQSEGSLTGAAGCSGCANTNWPKISTGSAPTYYNGNLINGQGSEYPQYATGARQLNLGIVTMGSGATQSVDLIRRSYSGESSNITGERYYAQASLRVLVSDNPADIMNLPCIDGSTQPFDLSKMATLPSTWSTSTYAPLQTLYNKLTANNVVPLPLAASGSASASGGAYNSLDGYWVPKAVPVNPPAGQNAGDPWPIIKGYLKIEEQTAYGSPCGTWKDVTVEILSYGYVGRNINPVPQSLNNSTLNPQWIQNTNAMDQGQAPNITVVPASAAALGYQNGPAWTNGTAFMTAQSTPSTPKTCLDPHPYAVIRLERIRDNPTSLQQLGYVATGKLTAANKPKEATINAVCGTDQANPGKLVTGWTPQVSDFWPNTLFDTREGTLRDSPMSSSNPALPTLNGTMHYIEVDGKNLASWFGGKIGTLTTSGQGTKDPSVAPNNFVFYVSDRRGNYSQSQSITGGWPPLSYTKNETGEFGWNDLVNFPGNSTTGCPNSGLDNGEDADKTSVLYTYGANNSFIQAMGVQDTSSQPLGNGQIGIFAGLNGTGVVVNSVCATTPSYATNGIWPMMLSANTNAVRENPALFFRRAVKLVNASLLTATGPCPGGNTCGLTIASENPVYVQGDFNANSGGNGFGDPEIATSIAADAVTLLSDQWNDMNSFTSPYAQTNRNAVTSYYRTAIVAGQTPYFSNPSGVVSQDYGTDGGVHNYLRYLENWSGDTLNYKGSIIFMYYSRQANSTFKCCNQVYQPPTRGYNFDTNFLTPALLPPRTPLFRDTNTTGWTRLMLPSQ